jgi:hypothetical protein
MPQLKYLKRQDLNDKKYNACIKNAINQRIYAYSWYLDIVADQWDVLVYGDYEAVLPVTLMKLKRNLWFPKIYTPPFVQQLGIFGSENSDSTVIKAFYDTALKFKPKIYNFNDAFIENIKFNLKALPNYELNLLQSYSVIYAGYSTNLKRKLKKFNPNFRIEFIEESATILNFIFEFAKPKMNQNIRNKFNVLFRVLKEKNKVETYSFYEKNTLLAVAVFLIDQNRIINLLPISNDEGKTQNAMAFLLDFIIQKNAEKEVILDFEGSSLEGIANFYKSFGAINKPYYQYKSNSIFY